MEKKTEQSARLPVHRIAAALEFLVSLLAAAIMGALALILKLVHAAIPTAKEEKVENDSSIFSGPSFGSPDWYSPKHSWKGWHYAHPDNQDD